MDERSLALLARGLVLNAIMDLVDDRRLLTGGLELPTAWASVLDPDEDFAEVLDRLEGQLYFLHWYITKAPIVT